MIATNFLLVQFYETLLRSLYKSSMAACVLPFLSFCKSIKSLRNINRNIDVSIGM